MTPEEKQFILEHAGQMSPKEIASRLQLREGKVKRYLEQKRHKHEGGKETAAAFGFPLFFLMALVLGLIFYSNSFQASFHLDDIDSVAANEAIRDLSQPGLMWQYNPARFLAYYSFAVNYALGGTDVFGYHLFNFLIHLASACFVFLLIRILFRTPNLREHPFRDHAGVIAGAAGLIFLCHPAQTQAVTYIVQRMASMAACFYILGVYCYVRARIGPKGLYPVLALICAALAFLTKPTAYTFPFALALTEWLFFRGDGTPLMKRLARLAPFFILQCGVFAFFYTGWIAEQGLADAFRFETRMPRLHYLLSQLHVLRTYLRIFVFPVGLNLDYDYPVAQTLLDPGTLASLLTHGVLIVTACAFARREPLLSFGILWFYGTLVIESSLVVFQDVIFEHRMYLPMAGLAAAAALMLRKWIKPDVRYGAFVLALAFVLGGMTYARNGVWQSEVSLWEDTLVKSPEKARPNMNLGKAYADTGRFREGQALLEKAVRLAPEDPVAHNTFGRIYAEQKQYEKAQASFERALELDPEYWRAWQNLGAVYKVREEYDKAVPILEKAVQMNPLNADAFRDLGMSYAGKKENEKAVEALRESIRLKPVFESYYNLGLLLNRMKRPVEAIEAYIEAVRLNPRSYQTYNNLGVLFKERGDLDSAVRYYRAALEIQPAYDGARYNLAVVDLAQGRREEALGAVQQLRRQGSQELANRLESKIFGVSGPRRSVKRYSPEGEVVREEVYIGEKLIAERDFNSEAQKT